MIDDLRTIGSLMERIRAALPMRAHVGRDVLGSLSRESLKASLSHRCDITEIRYAGDEGGILCTLDFDDHASKAVYIVSIGADVIDTSDMSKAEVIAAIQDLIRNKT